MNYVLGYFLLIAYLFGFIIGFSAILFSIIYYIIERVVWLKYYIVFLFAFGFLLLIRAIKLLSFLTIPSFATAPALIVVGFLMMQQVGKIAWDNLIDAAPCFICMTMMGFAYSISEGIALGVISWVVLHLFAKKTETISLLMYILAIIFVLKYFLI